MSEKDWMKPMPMPMPTSATTRGVLTRDSLHRLMPELDLTPLCGNCRKPWPTTDEELEDGKHCRLDDDDCLEKKMCEHETIDVQTTIFGDVEYLCSDECRARLKKREQKR